MPYTSVMSDMSEKPLRGVNLGGWLVLEKWMTPSLFRGTNTVDEYTFMQVEGAAEKIQRHRETFIVEEDWEWLAEAGIDIVRIPVGYWIIRNDWPYREGTHYLDWAFEMAEKYHIKVLIDLHGAPQSQNGNDHSGRAGRAGWFSDKAARAQTQTVLQTLHARYKHSLAYWGLQLLNEPRTHFIQRTLRRFYRNAAASLDSAHAIVFHDGFTPRLLNGALRYDKRAVMDVHLYHMASWIARLMRADHFVAICQWWYGALLRHVSRTQPIIIGEWSIVLRGESLRRFTNRDAMELQRRFGQKQLEVYEQYTTAWFYWTYKTEERGAWHFRSLVEDEILEIPPRDR